MAAGFSMAQVNDKSAAVARMSDDWGVIEALLGGTPAMRKWKSLLPKQPREADEDYAYRLSVATLFPAYDRTVTVMAGKPFSKPVTVGDDVPAQIADLIPNIDNQGKSLHVFASKAFHELVAYGFAGILVDYTKTEGSARTKADEKALGARPWWVLYRHDAILETRWEETAQGWALSMVRLLESKRVPDGEFGEQEIQQVRVLRPGSWEIYRQSASGGQWVVEESGTTTLGFIPFVPLIANAKSLEEGRAPLRDLAYLNVKHWQQQSDLDDSLRYAIKPIITLSGLTDTSKQIVLQAGGLLNLPTGASLDVKQGQSEAITVGRTELEALEQQMIQTGAELLVATPGQRTATEASNDAEANKSSLQRLAEEFEDSIDLALQYTAEWLRLPEGGSVTLFSDYASGSLTDASMQMIKELYALGLITGERAIKEMQRRAVLATDFDAQDEVSLASEQAQPLGMRGNNTDDLP